MFKSRLNQARGELFDPMREVVKDFFNDTGLFTTITKQNQIRKEPFASDHVVYFHTDTMDDSLPYTVEVHVEPSTGYSEVYVLRADNLTVLDQFVIDDFEDYAPAEVDRVVKAVEDEVSKGDRRRAPTRRTSASYRRASSSRRVSPRIRHRVSNSRRRGLQMKKRSAVRSIKNDATALIEQLVRQGYTLEEAKKIAESRSPESVSSAADVLSAFGISDVSHLRKIASAIDDEEGEPKDFTDDTEGDVPPADGEAVDGDMPADDGLEGDVPPVDGDVFEEDEFSEFALGDDISDVDLTAALEAIATIADAVLVSTGDIDGTDPDYSEILDILGGLDDAAVDEIPADGEIAPDVPEELVNSVIQIHTAEDGIESVSVMDDEGLPVVTGVEPSEDDVLLFEDAEPIEGEAEAVDEVVACLRTKGSSRITSRYVALKSGWSRLDSVRSSVWRKASSMVLASGVKSGTKAYFGAVALLASALYNRYVAPAAALWASCDKTKCLSRVARVLLKSSSYVDGGMDGEQPPKTDVPFMSDKIAEVGVGADTGSSQDSDGDVVGGSSNVQDRGLGESVFDFDSDRVLDVELPSEDGASTLMQFTEVSSGLYVMRNPRLAGRLSNIASTVSKLKDGDGLYFVKSSVFGYVGVRAKLPKKLGSSLVLSSKDGAYVVTNGNGGSVDAVSELESAYMRYLVVENRRVHSELRRARAGRTVRSSRVVSPSRNESLFRRVRQLRSALAERDATIERLRKVVSASRRPVRSAVTHWAVVDNTSTSRYQYYFDMSGEGYTLDGDYPQITESDAKSLLKKLERKYPDGDWSVVPVDGTGDDYEQLPTFSSRRRSVRSSCCTSRVSHGRRPVRSSARIVPACGSGTSRIVSSYRKRIGQLEGDLKALTSNAALVDEFKSKDDGSDLTAVQFKANVDFLTKSM